MIDFHHDFRDRCPECGKSKRRFERICERCFAIAERRSKIESVIYLIVALAFLAMILIGIAGGLKP